MPASWRLSFEAACAGFVIYVLPGFKPYYFTDFYDRLVAGISDQQIADFARNRHDPELGWDYRPNERLTDVGAFGRETHITVDGDGARTLPGVAGPGLIAAYGDFFTAGSNVNDDQTWEYFLSRLTGTRVANFGVAGYGPDQALLKLERNFRRGLARQDRAPGGHSRRSLSAGQCLSAVLCADGNRRYLQADVPGRGGTMAIVNLAPRPLASRAEFMQVFEQAKNYDYWYRCRMQAAVTPQFPYSLTVAQVLVLRPFRKQACTTIELEVERVLLYLLERFQAHAVANHYIPVFVIIPEAASELKAGKSRIDPALLAKIAAAFAGRIKVIDLAPLARERIDPRDYNIADGYGHLSANGNRLVATLLGDQLRAETARRDGRRCSPVTRPWRRDLRPGAPPPPAGTRRPSSDSCGRARPRRPTRRRPCRRR